MNLVLLSGALLTLVGTCGYAVGVAVAYPGRAFSLTAVMLGVPLVLIGRSVPAEGGQ